MADKIRSLLSLIFAIAMMYQFLECRMNQNRKRYLFGLYIAAVIICDGFIIMKFGYIVFRQLYPVVVQLPIFLAFVFISKFNFVKVFFVHSTAIAVTASFSLFGMIIAYFWGSDKTVMYIITYLLYVPSWIFVYRYMRPSVLYMLNNTDQGWIGFCIIPLAYNTLLFLVSNYDVDSVNIAPAFRNVVIVAILSVAAYSLILRFFKQTREQLTLQNERNILQMQVTAAHTNLEALKESHGKTMVYRHDMRHHLSLIDAYLSENNMEAARKYIAEIGKSIESIAVEKYCNNYPVNLILCSYIEKAKNEQIKVETQINLPEKNIISDMDLCVFFSNALENAVNACKLIPGSKNRTLKIICTTKNEKLFMQIANSFEGTVTFVNNFPISKEANHGFGTKSIAAIAEKYNGLCSFTAENGLFKTSVIL